MYVNGKGIERGEIFGLAYVLYDLKQFADGKVSLNMPLYFDVAYIP